MKLIEAIRDLCVLDEEGTIYASQPWTGDSEAIVAHEPKSGGLPDEAQQLGLIYFLEVFIARDVVESWIASLDAQPTLRQKCKRLIQRAATDA
jgi:hypothetical protein